MVTSTSNRSARLVTILDLKGPNLLFQNQSMDNFDTYLKGQSHLASVLMIYLTGYAQVISKGAVLMHFESIWLQSPV